MGRRLRILRPAILAFCVGCVACRHAVIVDHIDSTRSLETRLARPAVFLQSEHDGSGDWGLKEVYGAIEDVYGAEAQDLVIYVYSEHSGTDGAKVPAIHGVRKASVVPARILEAVLGRIPAIPVFAVRPPILAVITPTDQEDLRGFLTRATGGIGSGNAAYLPLRQIFEMNDMGTKYGEYRYSVLVGIESVGSVTPGFLKGVARALTITGIIEAMPDVSLRLVLLTNGQAGSIGSVLALEYPEIEGLVLECDRNTFAFLGAGKVIVTRGDQILSITTPESVSSALMDALEAERDTVETDLTLRPRKYIMIDKDLHRFFPDGSAYLFAVSSMCPSCRENIVGVSGLRERIGLDPADRLFVGIRVEEVGFPWSRTFIENARELLDDGFVYVMTDDPDFRVGSTRMVDDRGFQIRESLSPATAAGDRPQLLHLAPAGRIASQSGALLQGPSLWQAEYRKNAIVYRTKVPTTKVREGPSGNRYRTVLLSGRIHLVTKVGCDIDVLTAEAETVPFGAMTKNSASFDGESLYYVSKDASGGLFRIRCVQGIPEKAEQVMLPTHMNPTHVLCETGRPYVYVVCQDVQGDGPETLISYRTSDHRMEYSIETALPGCVDSLAASSNTLYAIDNCSGSIWSYHLGTGTTHVASLSDFMQSSEYSLVGISSSAGRGWLLYASGDGGAVGERAFRAPILIALDVSLTVVERYALVPSAEVSVFVNGGGEAEVFLAGLSDRVELTSNFTPIAFFVDKSLIGFVNSEGVEWQCAR